MEPSTCLIDDFGPLPVVAPATVDELREVVRRAAADGQALYPVGGRTMLDLGLPPERPGLAVDTRRLAEVIDYPARDMTVTVRAGITLARLQELLRGENQRLPVDVPLAEQATLGGALATNASGPRRHGFGTLRDYVIGISVVNDEGHEVKAGGRVVKNVAGYDLCKLHIGALGTLGIISQVTLKLRPLPEEQAIAVLACRTEDLEGLLTGLHATRTEPVGVELVNRAAFQALGLAAGEALPDEPWVLLLGMEHSRPAVAWQVHQLIKELSTAKGPGIHLLAGSAAAPIWQALTNLPARSAQLTFKTNLLPSAVAAFCRQASELGEGLLLQAHAATGVVIGHVEGGLTLERAAAMLKKLQQTATAAAGNLIVPRCPPAWKKTLPVWGAPRDDAWLMRQVKERLDPRRLFNPGRFLDEM